MNISSTLDKNQQILRYAVSMKVIDFGVMILGDAWCVLFMCDSIWLFFFTEC
jgi:hypothetical protein